MAVVLQTAHAEKAHLPRLQHSVKVAGCSAIARYRARERPRCAGSLTLCSLDDGLHRGSPRRLSTEVFATPSHHTSNDDHSHTLFQPSRPSSDDHVATRCFNLLSLLAMMRNGLRADLQRTATRHARLSLGTQALRSRLDRYQIEPISPLGTAQAETLTGHATNTRAGGCPNRLDVAQPIPDRHRANCCTRHPEPSMQPP